MDLSNLLKTVKRGKKRVGRGKRGARGAKSGRGTKGALKRGKMPLYFEGGALPLTKRIPMLRGKGKNKPKSVSPLIVNVEELNSLKEGSVVTVSRLIKSDIIDKKEAKKRGVKILGKGELKKKLKIKDISCSRGAEEKIIKIGGIVRKSQV
jgi:large subunit ribosomal protein L15